MLSVMTADRAVQEAALGLGKGSVLPKLARTMPLPFAISFPTTRATDSSFRKSSRVKSGPAASGRAALRET